MDLDLCLKELEKEEDQHVELREKLKEEIDRIYQILKPYKEKVSSKLGSFFRSLIL